MAKENNNTAFKSTPIGMIPIDWDIIQIGEVGTLFKGKGIAKTEVVEEGLPCIRYAELYTKYNTKFTNTFSFCNEESALLSQKIINGDIVFAGSGETLEDIGKCAVYLGDSVAYAGGDTIILRPEKVDSTYLSYLLNYDSVVKQRSVLGQGNSVVHIYPKGIATILVQIPPTKEQTKIAQILSTWDVSIETLQQLITKKEIQKKILENKISVLVKKNSKSKKNRLGDNCELITKGTTPTTNGFSFETNGVNFIKIESILADGSILKDKVAFISMEAHQSLKRSQLKADDVLISIAGALGRVTKVNSNILPANTNQALGIIRLKQNGKYLPDFIYHHLRGNEIQNRIDVINVQAAQANLSLENLNSFMIPDIDIQFQKMVISILSSCDEEIQILKTSLAHYKQQKQGLMQVLLTGKKRVKI